jgi:alpha-galactosidase
MTENRRHDPKKTRFQAQRELFRLYRETIGEESYLMGCGLVTTRQVAGYADAMRVGTDTGAHAGFGRRPLASDGNPQHPHGFWFPIRSLVATSLDTPGVLATDPDVTYSGRTNKCTDAQLRTWHSLLGVAGGMLMTSESFWDERFQTPEAVRMFEIMHPIGRQQGWAFAGGTDPSGREFGFVAERPFGNFASMVIWNPEHSQPGDLGITHVPAEKIGAKFHAWSFWDERYLGVVDRSYTARSVAPYEGRLLRLTPVSGNGAPALIGSNLHITMGAEELKAVRSDAAGMEVELQPGAGAIEGKLYIHSRTPLEVAAVEGCRAFVAAAQEDVYAIVVSDRQATATQKVKLVFSTRTPRSLASYSTESVYAEVLKRSAFANPASFNGVK